MITDYTIKQPNQRRSGFGTFIFFSFWTIVCLIAGFLVYYILASEEIDLGPIALKTKEIIEKPYYSSSLKESRYIDINNSDIFQELLTSSQNNFIIDNQTTNPNTLENYENFILVNAQNQFNRLSGKFNYEIEDLVTIKIIDDWERYQSEMDIKIEGNQGFMAYETEGKIISVFIDKNKTSLDKFILASTISHEMVHVFQYHKYPYIFDKDQDLIWLYEGMAEAWKYPKEDNLIKKDVLNKIPNLSSLKENLHSGNADDYSAGYAVAQDFFSYLENKYTLDILTNAFKKAFVPNYYKRPPTFQEAFEEETGENIENVYQNWLAEKGK